MRSFLSFLVAVAAGTTYAQQSAYGQCGGKSWTGSTSCVAGYTCTTSNSYYAQCTPVPTTASGQQSPYGQCGGQSWTGLTSCGAGFFCTTSNPYYAQCVPQTAVSGHASTTSRSISASTTRTSTALATTKPASSVRIPKSKQSAYGQCGGQGWTGPTSCTAGYGCTTSNAYYAQCVPSSTSATVAPTAKSSATTTTTTKTTTPISSTITTTTLKSSTPATSATSSKSVSTTSSTAAAASGSVVSYAGVNIAGFDFGCGTDGTCPVASADNPGQAGINQIKHFITDDGLNAFRLPVSWQYLVNNNLGGTLDPTNFANYDALVQGCLNAGAKMCLIDIHNYARWNGAIIGQGGPTNAQFTSLWSQLAAKYKSNSNVAFGIMNEPHDVDITTWATTVQAAVTAIRNAGATTQKILLPGNNYSSAAQFISNGSGAALLPITNLDGTTTNLIFDVHQYLDSDGSGTHTNCVTNNVASFTTLGNWLRSNKRQAFLSETGGGPNDSSCLTNVCQELSYLNANSDVFLGWTGWAAGAFDTSYTLSETPFLSGTTYTDQPLVQQCIAGLFKH